MTSTLWFWIILACLLLILVFLIRRYLGRVILILLFLFVLLFIYKWLNPVGAEKILLEMKAFPVQITNIVNQKVLGNTVLLALPEGVDSWLGTASSQATVEIIQTGSQLSGDGLDFVSEVAVEELSGELVEVQGGELQEVGSGAVEDEEIYYLPSNPKPVEKTEPVASSSALSAEDLREAGEIFGN